MECTSPALAPNLAITHHNTLQTIQNNALRIITGCTQTTPTNHLHYEAQVLTLQDHINMGGKQFLAAASANPDHPCHYMLAHQPTPRSIKTIPRKHYTVHRTPQHHPPTFEFTHSHELHKHSHTKTRSQDNIRYSSPRNTPLRTRTTTCGPSTPEQASLRTSHCSGNLPKENR